MSPTREDRSRKRPALVAASRTATSLSMISFRRSIDTMALSVLLPSISSMSWAAWPS